MGEIVALLRLGAVVALQFDRLAEPLLGQSFAQPRGRAIQLADPLHHPEHALRVLALITAMRGETKAADDLISRALAATPADPETLTTACFFYTLVGDGERAAALGRRATEVDPLYALHWTGLGFAYASLGRHDEAAAAARHAFDVDPHDLPTQAIAPLVLYGRGDLERLVPRPDAAPSGGASAGGSRALRGAPRSR